MIKYYLIFIISVYLNGFNCIEEIIEKITTDSGSTSFEINLNKVKEYSTNHINENATCQTLDKCSIIVHYRICNFWYNLTQDEIKLYSQYKEPSFRLDIHGKIFDTFRHYLLCSQLQQGKYLKMFINNTDPSFAIKFKSKYTNLYHLTYQLSFTSYSGTLNLFEKLNQNVEVLQVFVEKDILILKTHFIVGLKIKIYFSYKLKCDHPYYGSTCLAKCESDKKMKCSYESVNGIGKCKKTCKRGYTTNVAQYVDSRGFDFLTQLCNYTDQCLHEICMGLCLQYNEKQAFCGNVKLVFTSQFSSFNISSDIFFIDEFVSISFDKISLGNIDLTVYEIYPELNHSNKVFKNNILEYYLTGDRFRVLDQSSENVHELSIEIVFTKSNIKWSRTKKFRIIGQITNPRMYHQSTGLPVQFYLYVNENIVCNSSALPEYSLLYLWHKSPKNDIEKYGKTKKIQSKWENQNIQITCYIDMILKDRKVTPQLIKKTVFVKIFERLYWNTNDTIINESSEIYCHTKSYIQNKIHYVQLKGTRIENLERATKIKLVGKPGGFYSFICTYKVSGQLRMGKTTSFLLRKTPSQICFHISPIIRGSFAHCDHNGFMRDEYEVLLTYYSYENSFVRTSEDYDYVRIPYKTSRTRYKIICTIQLAKSTVQNKILGKEITGLLNEGVISIYHKKNETDCHWFGRNINDLLILADNSHYLKIYNPLFFFRKMLTIPVIFLNYLLALVAINVFFNFVAFIFYYKMYLNSTSTLRYTIYKNIHTKCRLIKSYVLHIKISGIAKSNIEAAYINDTAKFFLKSYAIMDIIDNTGGKHE